MMKFQRLYFFVGMISMLAFSTACSQFFLVPTPAPARLPTSVPSITPILVVLPSPTNAPIPTVTRATTLVPVSSATVTPTVLPSVSSQAKRITFPAGGASAMVGGTVPANGTDRYVLRALAGQAMTIQFSAADNVTLQVSGADGSVLASGGAKFSSGTFSLTVTQDYFVSVISSRDAPANFTLQISIPPLSSPTPVPSPTSAPHRITFATGAISATVTGSTFTSGQDSFVIRALAGQTMTVNVTSTQGPVILIIYGADGNVLISDHAGASNWSGVLPSTQDYMIDTRSVGANVVPFTLTVTIPPK